MDFLMEIGGTVPGEPWPLESPRWSWGCESAWATGWSDALPLLCPVDAPAVGQSQRQKPKAPLWPLSSCDHCTPR